MPVTHRIIAQDRLAIVTAEGEVTAAEIITDGKQLITHKDWQNGFSILRDYRGITDFNLGAAGILEIIDEEKKQQDAVDMSRCAVVVARSDVYGKARMWQSLSSGVRPKKAVFKELKEALSWLEVATIVFSETGKD